MSDVYGHVLNPVNDQLDAVTRNILLVVIHDGPKENMNQIFI
jgi:hypothetical protein